MRAMKRQLGLWMAAMSCLWVGTAVGQLQLRAPGQDAVLYADANIFADALKDNGSWFRVYQDLGKPWRFIFTGIEAFADADDVPGFYAWDGRIRLHEYTGENSDPAVAYGGWNFWGSINVDIIGPISFFTSYLDDPGPEPQYMWWPEAQVYANRTVNAGWTGFGNTRDPDGYWEILGSVIPNSLAPVGALTFSHSYYPEGSTPKFDWEVIRDGDRVRAGFIDETNPGRGEGVIHAPEIGTLNPNNAPDR